MLYSNIRKKLHAWHYHENERKMPWKNEKNPYKIWLSEIILQQTRVEQGLDYYNRFLNQFPTVFSLANAEEQTVFKLWEGLGYYNRCANLLKTARIIVQQYNGKFPSTYSEILALPGIGPYTAAAISSFAFDLPYAVLDGNVYRVLARLWNNHLPIDSNEGKKRFTQLAQNLLDKNDPSTHNQAIMDFGATVCKPKAPLCTSCTFNSICNAFKNDTVQMLPIKHKKLIIKERFFNFLILRHQQEIAIELRSQKDIWKNLYQFPLLETSPKKAREKLSSVISQINDQQISDLIFNFEQKLTHQKIKASFIEIIIEEKNQVLINDLKWVKISDLPLYPFPKLLNDFLKSYKLNH